MGGVITSGGGFSAYYTQPWYQSSAVASYFTTAAGEASYPGYNSAGRGYPDLSFIAVSYPVVVGGYRAVYYGTSASTPVAAAMGECSYADTA